MTRLKLKKKLKMTLLILSLTVSTNAFADQALVKRLMKGDKAPYNGSLFNDEATRQVDEDLLYSDQCDKKIGEILACEGDSSVGTYILYFVGGLASGALITYAISH